MKNYIGREEAFEISLERGFEKLPRKGVEYIQSLPKLHLALGLVTPLALGKDEQGFYLREQEQ